MSDSAYNAYQIPRLIIVGRGIESKSFLTAALTRVMRATVSIPAVASVSVLHSDDVGGSVVGVVRPL